MVRKNRSRPVSAAPNGHQECHRHFSASSSPVLRLITVGHCGYCPPRNPCRRPRSRRHDSHARSAARPRRPGKPIRIEERTRAYESRPRSAAVVEPARDQARFAVRRGWPWSDGRASLGVDALDVGARGLACIPSSAAMWLVAAPRAIRPRTSISRGSGRLGPPPAVGSTARCRQDGVRCSLVEPPGCDLGADHDGGLLERCGQGDRIEARPTRGRRTRPPDPTRQGDRLTTHAAVVAAAVHPLVGQSRRQPPPEQAPWDGPAPAQ